MYKVISHEKCHYCNLKGEELSSSNVNSDVFLAPLHFSVGLLSTCPFPGSPPPSYAFAIIACPINLFLAPSALPSSVSLLFPHFQFPRRNIRTSSSQFRVLNLNYSSRYFMSLSWYDTQCTERNAPCWGPDQNSKLKEEAWNRRRRSQFPSRPRRDPLWMMGKEGKEWRRRRRKTTSTKKVAWKSVSILLPSPTAFHARSFEVQSRNLRNVTQSLSGCHQCLAKLQVLYPNLTFRLTQEPQFDVKFLLCEKYDIISIKPSIEVTFQIHDTFVITPEFPFSNYEYLGAVIATSLV